MKKPFFTFLFLLFTTLYQYAQTPSWQWAKSFSPSGNTRSATANDIKCDKEGNIYVTGTFSDTISFDTIQLITAGSSDIFVAKFDPNGKAIWATRTGNLFSDQGRGLFLDENNNTVWICGSLQDTIQYNGYVGYGNTGFLVASYNTTTGANTLQKFINNTDNYNLDQDGMLNSMLIDADGNFFFNGFAATYIDLGGNGWRGSFTAKYDSQFNLQWVTGVQSEFEFDYFGGGGSSLSVLFDKDGNCINVGAYHGKAKLQDSLLTNTTYDGTSSYFAKYEPQGGYVQSIKKITGVYNQIVSSISGNNDNVLYLGGQYIISCVFDDGETFFDSLYSYNYFVAQSDYNGSVNWARDFRSTSYIVEPFTLATDPEGNVTVMGAFNNTISFGRDTLKASGDNLFTARLNSNGELNWSKISTTQTNDPPPVSNLFSTTDAAGNFIVCGSTNGSIVLNFDSINTPITQGMFIAKLNTTTVSGIKDIKPLTAQLQVYPNPNKGSFNIQVVTPLTGQNYSLQLTDITGRKLAYYYLQPAQTGLTINTDLPSGYYFLQLIANDKVLFTSKVSVIK